MKQRQLFVIKCVGAVLCVWVCAQIESRYTLPAAIDIFFFHGKASIHSNQIDPLLNRTFQLFTKKKY